MAFQLTQNKIQSATIVSWTLQDLAHYYLWNRCPPPTPARQHIHTYHLLMLPSYHLKGLWTYCSSFHKARCQNNCLPGILLHLHHTSVNCHLRDAFPDHFPDHITTNGSPWYSILLLLYFLYSPYHYIYLCYLLIIPHLCTRMWSQ